MNPNDNYNNGGVTPYRATGNLNTAINNPSVNINDTMNVNIQSMATNTVPVNNQNPEINSNIQANNQIPIQNNVSYNTNNVQNVIPQSNYEQKTNQTMVNRTYVTTDNKPKKKNISSNLGPEFKIALLIIVILLVFIFLLPVISDLLGGY